MLLRDLFRAGFQGRKIAFGYSVNQKLVESLPAEVVQNIFTISPSSDEASGAYARLVKLMASPIRSLHHAGL